MNRLGMAPRIQIPAQISAVSAFQLDARVQLEWEVKRAFSARVFCYPIKPWTLSQATVEYRVWR